MTVFFVYTHDNIQKAVKLETSLLAERRPAYNADSEAPLYNDLLVFDEEYGILFKRLFSQAHAEVIKRISSNYLKDTPTDLALVYQEFPDFRQDMDFVLWLTMSEDWAPQYQKSIDIFIEQFLIDYICWRWFETKSPQDAVTYNARLEETMKNVQQLLSRKLRPLKRLPSFP